MYLYLKYEGKLKCVPNVSFQDCVRPQINEVTEDRIEPALWFKVLVCDAVFVDIDQRLVFWNAEKLQEAEYIYKTPTQSLKVENVLAFFKQREKIFDEKECYDFDPTVDELFDTATHIFNSLSLETYDREGHAPTYERIMQMLHVYILPNMRFYQRHIDQLSTVLTWIEKHHERIENQIQKKDTCKRNTENSLRKQREDFLTNEDFSSLKYISSLDETFLKTLLKHLEKDFRQKNEVLLELHDQIAPLRNSLSESDLQCLEERRSKRNCVHESLQRVVVAREQIKNVVSRQHVKKKFKRKKQSKISAYAGHMLYLQISRGIDEVNMEIQELINQKIKISSVRESVLQTIREINEDGMSFGYNRKKGSFEIETDLFSITKKPEEWATIEEKVKLMLIVKQAGYRKDFEKFCERIKLRCQNLFDEAKIFSNGLESDFLATPDLNARRSARMFMSEHHGAGMTQPGNPSGALSFACRWSVGSLSKHDCEQICKEVIKHLSDTSYNLAVEINSGAEVSQLLHNKVYICYEEHVSEELMPVLSQVYEESYRWQCKSLHSWISSISTSDFGFGDRKMSNLIFYDPSSGSSESSKSSSIASENALRKNARKSLQRTTTLETKKISDMTFEELYQVCSSPGNSLPQFFKGALDMDLLSDLTDGLDSSWTTVSTSVGSENDSLLSPDHADSDSSSLNSEHHSEKDEWDNIDELEISDNAVNLTESTSPVSCSNGKEVKSRLKRKPGLFSKLKRSFRSTGSSKPVIDAKSGFKRELDDISSGHFSPEDASFMPGASARPTKTTKNHDILTDHGHENRDVDEGVELRRKAESTAKYSSLPKVKDKFYNTFNKFPTFLHEEDQACSLFAKLRQITLALKYVENCLTDARSAKGEQNQACADDLLDIIIFLLCNLDENMLRKLYAHLNLIIHLCPRFMQGNAHDYALTTFTIAYQHLFEQQVLQHSGQ